MEHIEIDIVIDEDDGKYITVEHNVGTLNVTTMNCTHDVAYEGVMLELPNDIQIELIKALIPNILEDSDASEELMLWLNENVLADSK